MMPIFEFRCSQCGHEHEALVRGAERPQCPHCDSLRLERLMSAPAAHVRGNGSLPVSNACPPEDAPPCSPTCCRLP